MIVRDAAADLPRSLGSVRHLADELLVTDTGSTDETVAVAESLGASVDRRAWDDDFAATLNHVTARATGDWVLRLDADEAVDASAAAPLGQVMADPHVAACDVLRKDLADPADASRFTTMWVRRLFRRDLDLRLVGRCHPHFVPPLDRQAAARGQRLGRHPGITLTHWGYTADRAPAKRQRSVRLLQLELADRPGQLYYLIELLRDRLVLRDPQAWETLGECVKHLVPHLDAKAAPLPHAALLLETLLQWPADRLPSPLTPRRVDDLAARWFPRAPPLLWLRAGRAFAQEDFRGAAALLRRLIEMGESGTYDHHTGFDPAIVGEEARLNLAACLIKLAELKEARGLLTPLKQHPRVGERAAANLRVVEQLLAQPSR